MVIGGLVLTGTMLLRLPGMVNGGDGLGWLDALFLSSSAACTVGLSSVGDPWLRMTVPGLVLLGLLMQAGAVATVHYGVWMILGRVKLWKVAGVLALIQAVGALLFVLGGESIGRAVWLAMCGVTNTGFVSMSDARYAWTTHGVMASLIVVGGLGVFLLHLPNHRRIVITVTAGCYLIGVVMLCLSQLMPAIYDRLDLNVTANRVEAEPIDGVRLMRVVADSSFLAVSARSAGIDAMAIEDVRPAGRVALMGMMMIGASPGGTGGGIMTTVLALWVSTLWGKGKAVSRAAVVIVLSMTLLVSGVVYLLSLCEPYPLGVLLFESVSAVSTTGLSAGVSDGLTAIGKLVLVVGMVVGRVLPITILGTAVLRGR